MRFVVALLLPACFAACGGGGGSASVDTTQASTAPASAAPASAAIDITNLVFSNRAVDCADYADEYTSAVVDINRSIGFSGVLAITAGTNACLLTSNIIPNHDFNDGPSFPNATSEQSLSLTIPRAPVLAGSNSELSHGYWDGVLLNGVVVDVLSAGCWNGATNTPGGCADDHPWLINPLTSQGVFEHDSHNAHTQPTGAYHYHGEPLAMYDDNPGPDGSPVIGFAADGFPIYGPYFYDVGTGQVRKAESGYTLKLAARDSTTGPGGMPDGVYNADWEWTDAGDLDECNGMTVAGQYGYYVTEAYPHTMRCFKGVVDPSFAKN